MRQFKSELTLSVLPYTQHRLTLCPTHLKVTKPTKKKVLYMKLYTKTIKVARQKLHTSRAEISIVTDAHLLTYLITYLLTFSMEQSPS
jgi:hypothetical protein